MITFLRRPPLIQNASEFDEGFTLSRWNRVVRELRGEAGDLTDCFDPGAASGGAIAYVWSLSVLERFDGNLFESALEFLPTAPVTPKERCASIDIFTPTL